MAKGNEWAQIAREHVRVLAKQIGPRGATTEGERQAAGYARNQLEALGLDDVRLEPFLGASSAWIYLAAALSLAAWGLVFGFFLDDLGLLVAIGAHLAAAWLAYREWMYRDSPLRRLLTLWQADSQNVVGVISPSGPVERELVLLAYLDTAQAGFFWRGRLRRRAWGCLLPLALLGLPINAGVFLLTFMAQSWLFYLIIVFFWLLQMVALVALVRAGRAEYSPGANHNGTGVGAVLALVGRLRRQPLAKTRVWVLVSGCQETGCDGLRAFLNAHGPDLEDPLFVSVEGVGVGERLVCLTDADQPEVQALADQVAQAHPDLGLQTGGRPRRQSEIGLTIRRGFEGLTLTAWPAEGEEGLDRHRLDDTFEAVQESNLRRALALAWAWLQAVDQGDDHA